MRYLLLLCVLLLGACWVVAQSTANQATPSITSNNGTHTTIQGCLSSSNGNYTLTAKNGMKYALNGDTAVLSQHVGHEVKITGSESSAMNSTPGSSDSMGQTSSASERSIEVTSVKHISKTCSK